MNGNDKKMWLTKKKMSVCVRVPKFVLAINSPLKIRISILLIQILVNLISLIVATSVKGIKLIIRLKVRAMHALAH